MYTLREVHMDSVYISTWGEKSPPPPSPAKSCKERMGLGFGETAQNKRQSFPHLYPIHTVYWLAQTWGFWLSHCAWVTSLVSQDHKAEKLLIGSLCKKSRLLGEVGGMGLTYLWLWKTDVIANKLHSKVLIHLINLMPLMWHFYSVSNRPTLLVPSLF